MASNNLRLLGTIGPRLELHDRLIVAEALFRRLPLMTADAEIRNSGIVETVW